MNTRFFEIATVFAAILIAAPAVADEAPAAAKPVRHRQVERAPARQAAPVRTAAAQPSWTGGQVGGQGGVSQMAQGFAEPGSHLYPICGAPTNLTTTTTTTTETTTETTTSTTTTTTTTTSVVPPRFPSSECVETPFSFNGNKTSATGGGFLGYRVQFGTVVAGIEGDINAKSASASYTVTDSNRFRSESFYGTAKQGADGSIRGRIGYLVTPWTMVYGTGGVAFGSVSGSFNYSAHEIGCRFGELCVYGGCPTMRPCASAIGTGSWSTSRVGATGGGGIETLITPSLTLRLEYRYTDLGSFSESVPLRTVCSTTCSSPSSSATINLHPTFQTVTVGVGYNF
jgi:outer membrane immunogenic protein